MKKAFKIILTIIILIVLMIIGGMFYMTRGLETGINTEINGLDISDITNGQYEGNYKQGRWSNKLNVTVKDNIITKIEIVDDVTFPQENMGEELFSRVIERQNTKVDTIAGATVTSKAYLKSIENAFEK